MPFASRRMPLSALALLAASLLALAGAPPASAAPGRCWLPLAERLPERGKPTYVLSVKRTGTSCRTARRVALAFHACRTTTGTRCSRRLLGTWRCSARRFTSAARLFDGNLTCRSGRRRVRSSYHQRAASPQTCYGAASRDRRRPCRVPQRAFFPPLSNLEAGTAYECTPLAASDVCAFGTPARRARGHIALIGDSHALALRTPVDMVARARRWRGYSLTAPGCPFSAVVDKLYPGAREPCVEWYRSVLRWLRKHPEVSTVFVSSFAAMPIVVPPGQTYGAVKVAGLRRAWRALPRTIKRVIAIRDPPMTSNEQFACVRDSIKAGTPQPGTVCSRPRSEVLKWDTSLTAARLLRSRRYGSIDLTRFFCGETDCYPVVGRVLVYRDAFGHISTAFGGTLAPYLLQRVDRLLESR